MSIERKNVVDYSDIFYYAKEKYGIEWNTCCDIFHRTEFIRYNGVTNFYLYDMLPDFPEFNYDLEEDVLEKNVLEANPLDDKFNDRNKGKLIINQFMIENNVKELMVC